MLIGNYFKNINLSFKNHKFSGLSFNSNNCKKNYIFFAIKGNNLNGNKFINHAINKGAKTVVSNIKYEGFKKDVLFIRTNNVRRLLSETVSKIYRKKPKNLVAVTGTNGKSSIADFYLQILKLNKKKVASIGTLGINSNKNKIRLQNTTLDSLQLAKYLSKLKDQKIDNVILEASSHGLSQNRLDGLKFQIGIFTNLSHDHLDYHKSYKNYLNAKLYLFRKLLKNNSNIITDFDIPEYKKIKIISKKKRNKIYTISLKNGDLSVISHDYHGEKQLLKVKYKNKMYEFQLNLVGKIQLKNILMSMLAASLNNIKFQRIINIVNKIKAVPGRLEKIGLIKNNSSVILDYAHTPDALETCLQNIQEQFKNRKLSIVFGCGGNRDKFKRSIMGKIANKYCNKIYLTDDNPRNENPEKIRKEIKKGITKSKLYEIPNRGIAIGSAINNLLCGEVLIVAGKGHEKVQDYGKYKKYFSDKECILKYIRKKNRFLKKDLKLNILNEILKNKNISMKTKIRNGSINSKDIKKNDIFFAIKGKNKDGNKFVKEALKKGASLAIVNKINSKKNFSKQIKVKNSLDLLTKMSKIIRTNSSSKIIAITGSCGKTSLKELLKMTLNNFGKTLSSPKSFNNKYGVPLSLFNLNADHQYGIFEVGMDKKGEIDALSKIIKPDIGIITNISYAHAKNFKNIKQIAMAKSEIINNINQNGFVVLNADDEFFYFHKKIATRKKLNVLSFGMKKKADIKFIKIIKYKNKFKIFLSIYGRKKYFYVSNNFKNFIQNLLGAITVVSIYKNPINLNKNIFYKFKTPVGRGDITKIRLRKKNINLIDESYNSNPLSLKSAIENFSSIKTKNKKFMILGDMLELGKHSKKLHKKIIPIINSSKIDKVNIFGQKMKETFINVKSTKKGKILNKFSEINNLINSSLNNNDYLMIKGSNSTGLNKFTTDLKLGNLNAI